MPILKLAFCPTGPGGGVDPTCSPNTATGSSGWPDDVRKKLRALQSRLSRAKTVEAKAKTVLAINALIAEQNGVKATPAPKGKQSAKEALLAAAKSVPIKKLPQEGLMEFGEWNTWGFEAETGMYRFKTPSGRGFEIMLEDNHLLFTDEEQNDNVTGKGEAHFVFSEVSKAVVAVATRTKQDEIYFTADSESKGRGRLYSRLASGLAELVPNATVVKTPRDNGSIAFTVRLRKGKDIAFQFCPTGPGGGVDPTCSPDNAGTGVKFVAPVTKLTPEQIQSALEMYEAPSSYTKASKLAAKALKAWRAKLDDKGSKNALEALKTFFGDDVSQFPVKLMQSVGIDDLVLEKLGPDIGISVNGAMLRPDIEQNKSAALSIHVAPGGDTKQKGGDTYIHRILRNESLVSPESGKHAMHVENHVLVLPADMQRGGVGARIFINQVEGLTGSGITKIRTDASAAKDGSLIGYKVWPKLGYDGSLSPRQKDNATKAGVFKAGYKRKDGSKVQSLQATLETEAGRKWWEGNKESKALTFDLKPNSAGQQILAEYRANKIAGYKSKLKDVKFAFCPTGPGGGVDPTCSPHGASAGGYSTLLQETGTPVLKKALGTKNWPDEAKKKLRALQSKLSRAKTQAAKNIVIKAINAHIDAQNGVPAAPVAAAPVAAAPVPAAPVNPGLAAYQASVAANAAAIAARDASIIKVDTTVHPLLAAEGTDVEKWFVAANNNPNSPNKEAASSVRYYTGSGSAYINKSLRGLSPITETQAKMVKQIDGAMEKFKTPVNLVVTRAVGPNTQKYWVEGHVHHEKAYSSCSATAVRHAGYNAGWDKTTRCVISVPKGTPAMYIPKISAYPKERELLLGRGLKFKVTRREEKVPKDRMLKILYGSRAGVSTNDLRHKEYTLIHMEVTL